MQLMNNADMASMLQCMVKQPNHERPQQSGQANNSVNVNVMVIVKDSANVNCNVTYINYSTATMEDLPYQQSNKTASTSLVPQDAPQWES